MKTAVIATSSQALRIVVALAFLTAFAAVLADDMKHVVHKADSRGNTERSE